MDEPTSLADLCTVDDLTLRFWPLGYSSALLQPKASLRYLHELIALARPIDDVPAELRENFERVRKTFLYGLVEYDLFTVAADLSLLVLESALRTRFLTFYEGAIPVSENGEPGVAHADTFEQVREAAFKKRMKLAAGGRERPLPTSMSDLLAWARNERLLVGQRSRAIDIGVAEARNRTAHPTGLHRGSPVDAARAITRAAEYINQLWGAPTPGGRVFPAPIERFPRAAALRTDGAFVTFPSVRSLREPDVTLDGARLAVFLAAAEEDLGDIWPELDFRYRPGFQRTRFPCELLWGPGPAADLTPHLPRLESADLNDRVDYLDRLFVVRVEGEKVEEPRSPEDFAACELTDGTWHIMRADYPAEALIHVREHDRSASSPSGWCPACQVTELGRFDDRAAAADSLEQQT